MDKNQRLCTITEDVIDCVNKGKRFVLGIAGLILTTLLMVDIFLNLIVIFCTSAFEDQGDCYDSDEISLNLSVLLILLVSLLMLFYPCWKMFLSFALAKTRKDYFGLFVARGKTEKLLAVVCSILFLGIIIILFFLTNVEADMISIGNYCYIMFGILVVSGMINIMFVSKEKQLLLRKILLFYSFVYTLLMIAACIYAELHISGGGGQSDVTIWLYEASEWQKINSLDLFYMIVFIATLTAPWIVLSLRGFPSKKVFGLLLGLHLMLGVIILCLYAGLSFGQAIWPMGCDWESIGYYPSPIDKYAIWILFDFLCPFFLLYGGILVLSRRLLQ